LAALVRSGSEPAFEVLFERHGPAILAFCRQILGSHEEAEDAVQQTFASAHRALADDDRSIDVKPWLYTIARNRCLSMVRARKPDSLPLEEDLAPGVGLVEQAEQRAELRELVRDVADLPEQQRSALVLFELGDLSHEEIASVIGCEAQQVKGIVFRARTGLSERREARTASCEEIREELSTLRGGALRRGRLRHHLRECSSCTAFRDDVRRQRAQLAVLLPAAPSAALKAGVLGGTAAGSSAVAKLAVIGAVIGSVGGAGLAVERAKEADETPVAPAATTPADPAPRAGVLPLSLAAPVAQARRAAAHPRRAHPRRTAPARGNSPAAPGRERGISKASPQGQAAPGRTKSLVAPGRSKKPAAPPGLAPGTQVTPPRATPPADAHGGNGHARVKPAPPPQSKRP
jgi:RNA polymerase sigma factor (sigma-70 family)